MPSGARPFFFVLSLLATTSGLWMVHAWATAAVPWLGRHRRGLAAALVALFVIDRAANELVILRHDETAGLVHASLMVAIMTMALGAIPLALVYAATRLPARLRRRAPAAAAAAVESPAVSRRQVMESTAGAVLFGATGSMLGWGMVRGRHAFTLEEVPLRIPGLPRALEGYVIAQVSDLHGGALVGEPELEEGFALVRQARPDLIVVTGDMIDFDAAFAPMVARKLGELTARDGVTAILGNHDYYADADAVVAAMRGAGVDMLRDRGKVLRAGDGGGFALLGVDDLQSVRYGRQGPRLDLALASVPDDRPRILLSHQPSTVDEWAGQVAVQLSGHTHGGQINPGFSPLGLFAKYVSGAYAVGGTTLYVNRGFGTVGAPARIGAPPEVTRFVLVAA